MSNKMFLIVSGIIITLILAQITLTNIRINDVNEQIKGLKDTEEIGSLAYYITDLGDEIKDLRYEIEDLQDTEKLGSLAYYIRDLIEDVKLLEAQVRIHSDEIQKLSERF